MSERAVLSGLFALFTAGSIAGAVQPANPSILRDLSLDEALRVAGDEGKIVLASFQTAWDPASIEMDRGTWRNPRLKLAVDAAAIAIRIDAAEHEDLVTKHAIETLPTILFFRADGAAFDRITGYRQPQELQAEFEAVLSGKDAIQRARAGVERSAGRDPLLRERLGDALADASQHADALVEYLWCFDEALKRHIPYAATRRDLLAAAIARLGRAHPPAIAALIERRDARETALLAGDTAADSARELAVLNDVLNDRPRTLAVYDRLPADSRPRRILFTSVFDLLIEARRYADALVMSDPRPEFAEAARTARERQMPCCAVHYRGGRFVGETVVTRGARFVEALAGAGRIDDARRLIDDVLAYQDTAEHRAELIGRLRRGEARALADELAARAPPAKRPP